MKRLLILIGFLCCASAGHASAATYDTIKEQVMDEMGIGETDEGVAAYLHAIYGKEWDLTLNDVESLMKGDVKAVCGNKAPGTPGKDRLSCDALSKNIAGLQAHEASVRSLGRTLQATASSYELPISELPNRSTTLMSDLRGIVNMWGAGSGSIQSSVTGAHIRMTSVEEEQFEQVVTKVGDELKKLQDDEQVGAVWRYQYGIRLIQGDRKPRFQTPIIDGQQNANGTLNQEEAMDAFPERQYLYKRWDDGGADIEQALMDVWDKLVESQGGSNSIFTVPLSSTETAFIIFPKDLFTSALPDNVILWARIDGDKDGRFPFGDVGLQWETPLEPVLPSLVKDSDGTAILGGDYPPEPILPDEKPRDGSGLCTNPVTLRGYLCRAIEHDDKLCEESADAAPDTITLVQCKKEGEDRVTLAGPDVCREIGWEDDNKKVDPKTECSITLSCAAGCQVGDGGIGMTNEKDANGNIRICAGQGAQSQITYQIYHELVHANQACGRPPQPFFAETPNNATPAEADAIEDSNFAACCQLEGEAYRVQCDMMERDGVFAGMAAVGGIPFNAETCAEVLSNSACGGDFGEQGCYLSRTYPQNFKQAMAAAVQKNPKQLPNTCAAAISPATMDERVKQFKEQIEGQKNICAPGANTTYRNRIGNNLCFIGQCVEQSTEQQRIMGGKVPTGVGGEKAPWDNPLANAPLGNAVLNPPAMSASFSLYRPELLVREMEEAFCQAQGLPPLTPPILCAVAGSRQLSWSRTLGIEAAFSVLQQAREQSVTENDLLELTPALGSRVGTNLYGEYLATSNKSFADILTMAATLFEEMSDIDFPTQACPLGAGLPTPPAPPAGS